MHTYTHMHARTHRRTHTYILAYCNLSIFSTIVLVIEPLQLNLQRVYKNHLKMVKGCRIDTGLCKKDPPKTHGTRVICETGAGLGGQRARQA